MVRMMVASRWFRVGLMVLGVWVVLVGMAVWGAVWLVPLPARLVEADSVVVEWGDGEPAHVFLAADGRWRLETRLERVDPEYLSALLAYEDKRFWGHGGVDLVAVLRAVGSNVRRGRVVSGASTLTMQLVRMVEPRPRTLRSKVVEAFRAMQIERHLSKEEVLAAYLKFLPFGRNVEGLETAAWMYFGHDASALSPAEIAVLLAVPQSPNRRYPSVENAARLRAARDGIAGELLASGSLLRGAAPENLSDAEALLQIEATPVPVGFRAMPREVPHFAVWLRGQYPGISRLRTALDRSTQRTVEELVAAHRTRIGHLGADNAAVVVVDHESGALRAVVGSFDFADTKNQGQIPGFAVRRSSGSLLKPFILAQAIDEGFALPSHLVPDVAVNYAGYQPQNYSEDFEGLVRMDDALVRSLNIPFVQLVEQLGVERFLNLLRRLGAEGIDVRPGHYGLSVAIGGIAASPLELAGMYTALARRGDRAPMYFLKAGEEDGKAADYGAVFANRRGEVSAGSARLVREIMAQRGRPDKQVLSRLGLQGNRYAWKTGTSMGLRDAWTAGFGARHTVVVWAGNFDNRGQTGIVGSQAAVPLFFDVIEAVDPGLVLGASSEEETTEIEVCAYSGHVPTSACEHTKTVQVPVDGGEEKAPSRPCPFHVQRDVDVATGLALNLECRQSRAYETRAYVVWPTDVQRTMSEAGYAVPSGLPGYAPGCGPDGFDARPRIVSPSQESVIVLLKGVAASEQMVPLMAEGAQAGAQYNWFVNGTFVGSVENGAVMWWEPQMGAHEVVVTDEHGRSARIGLVVE